MTGFGKEGRIWYQMTGVFSFIENFTIIEFRKNLPLISRMRHYPYSDFIIVQRETGLSDFSLRQYQWITADSLRVKFKAKLGTEMALSTLFQICEGKCFIWRSVHLQGLIISSYSRYSVFCIIRCSLGQYACLESLWFEVVLYRTLLSLFYLNLFAEQGARTLSYKCKIKH